MSFSPIYVDNIKTHLGTLQAYATDSGLCLLDFDDRNELEDHHEHLKKNFNATLVNGSNKIIDQLSVELDQYFSGERKAFTVPLSIRGSEFQKRVWMQLMDIPYGKTRTYKDQAESIGNLKAIRAVASANGENPIAILIPCHRVVGSDGSLTGYAGGIWRKRYLLNLERSNTENLVENDGQTALW